MSPPLKARLIIDGYSLLHRDPELKPLLGTNLALARQLLIRKAERVGDNLARQTTIVFDGKGAARAVDAGHSSVEVLFAPSNLTADTVIERLVYADSDPAGVLVVTSDRLERQTVAATGADTMSCGDFLRLCGADRDGPADRTPRGKKAKGASLGDFFPG